MPDQEPLAKLRVGHQMQWKAKQRKVYWIPKISLCGKWLEKANIHLGDLVEVTQRDGGGLIIRVIGIRPARPPRSPKKP